MNKLNAKTMNILLTKNRRTCNIKKDMNKRTKDNLTLMI